ncbi:helix-turn-helix domain-containing protein [Dyella telluris]|uniref:Helix-turn-helix transcriptional regulator n=1 Tax=Dyella telluris TaxID=2763498 RepID=A0A7G8Q8Y5_9GAMM|nr:helix-turn-helix transcriptional regulator [Dyella telluris]QNK03243.1 helix-turn-helix transcriptional regulator [Dyella telluris]
MDPEVAFGKILRSLRLESKKTQEELAFDADLQRHYISLLERGSSSPTLKSIFRLSSALAISPDRLISLVIDEMRKAR